MKIEDLKEIIAYTGENEWIEFKVNDYNPQEIGEYISALSNSACLHHKEFGYLIFGIENSSKVIVGTSFKPKQYKIGNEELENWILKNIDLFGVEFCNLNEINAEKCITEDQFLDSCKIAAILGTVQASYTNFYSTGI